LENLSHLSGLKYLNSFEKESEDVMEQVKEQDQINENLFNHFKLR
jgi:hypothetical protein